MTGSQLDSIADPLRDSPLDLGGDVTKMRVIFDEMLGSAPLPEDVRTRTTSLGAIPAVEVRAGTADPGGGLALALLLAVRDARLPQPSSATVLSPWTDLTQSGDSMTTRADSDPALTRSALQIRAADHTAGTDPGHPLASPLFADLRGLPPLLIQVGGREILLDDSLRLAARAAHADVPVTLQTFPGAPHVFQGFAHDVDEAALALDRVAAFVTDHAHDEPED